MNSRQLLYAIGEIDEKFIVSAEKRLKDNKEDKKRVFNIIKSVAAAVFAVAVIGTVWVISYKNASSRINPGGTSQSDTQSETPDPYTTVFNYKVPEAENGETFKVTIKHDGSYSGFDFKNDEYIAAYLKCIYGGLHEDYTLLMPMVADEMIDKDMRSYNGEDSKYDKYFTQKAAELGYSYDEAVRRATDIARTIYPVTINEVSFSFDGINELKRGDLDSFNEFSSYIKLFGLDTGKITKAVCVYTNDISVRFNDIINLPLDGSSLFKSFIIFEYKGKTCVFDHFSPEAPIGYIEDMADGKIDTIETQVTVLEAAEHAFIDTNGTAYVSEKPLSLSAMDIVNVEYYRDYTSFVYGVVSVSKTGVYEIKPEDYALVFNEVDKITDKSKASILKQLFDNYLKDKSDPDDNIEFCVKLSDNKYAAKLKNVLRAAAASPIRHFDNAGGYPILAYKYGEDVTYMFGEDIPVEKIIILSGDDIYYGAEAAYNGGGINDDDAMNIFKACQNKYAETYNKSEYALLYKCITEYLNGQDEADNKTGNFSRTRYGKYVYIDFCYKISDEKYAVLYSIFGAPTAEFERMEVNINGYKFIYKNGNTLWVYDDGKIYDASHANLTNDEAARLYEVYNRYINQ